PEGPVENIGLTPKAAPAGPQLKIEEAVDHIRSRELLTSNGFWTVFHAILGLGPGVMLKDPDTQERINALERIASGGAMPGLDLMNGGEKVGVWKEVAEKTERYRDLAKKYQNTDGTFSTNYFRGPGGSTDKGAVISTSGHILEWLALALTDEELKEKWMQDAARALSQ